MFINLKTDIMSLLFTSGDIDNRKKRVPKYIVEKMESLEEAIIRDYDIVKNNHLIKENMLNKELKFSEMIPLLKGTDTIAKPVILNEKLEEITEDIRHIPLAEVKLYSYIYMKFKNIDKATMLLIFANIDDSTIREEEISISFEEAKEFFYETIEKYLSWVEMTTKWRKERNKSIKPIKFPFKEYREGQEKLTRGIYSTIAKNKMMFAQAPTGVGKTISSIFPAVHAVGEGKIDKIFYLTAKTVGAKVAEESFEKMREQGLKFRNISLTAKDKICFNVGSNCNPDSCEYAKNYYGKVNHVIFEMLNNENTFTRENIEKYAKEYKVCPFELSLDLSLYADAVICDYNYVFDPSVYLKRYFRDGSICDCAFLIDEAHNLVDRARGMYSAEIDKYTLKDALYTASMVFNTLEGLIKKALEDIEHYESLCDKDGEYSTNQIPGSLIKSLSSVNDEILYLFNKNMVRNADDFKKLGDLSNLCNQFIKIGDLYDDKYMFFVEKKDNTVLKLFCIDPSRNLKGCYKRGKSAIVFSATLSPLKYFRDILGGDDESYGISIDSPFDVKNREVILVDNVSTKYKDREKSYERIIEYIYSTVSLKKGNYMVFAPSFDYVNKLEAKFNELHPSINTIKQDLHMKEEDRETYLSKFEDNPSDTLVSFNVVSGIFGEGIDFKGDKLIGAIIVGVGLPMICLERNIIKNHFQKENGYGFDFAYTFPGLNKVIQAAGRVIRTDDDRGIIMLIDDRFGTAKYKSLLPKEWSNYHSVKDVKTCSKIVKDFWNK